MKQLSVLFSGVLLFLATSMVQAQKIAHLDVNSVLSLMPEKKKADERLDAISKAKGAEIQKIQQQFETLYKKYSEEAPKKTQAENEKRNVELQKLGEQVQQMQQAAQKDFLQKRETEYAPIEKKFQQAVDKVARANNWDYIIDANSPIFIYKGGTDATNAVKKELGL